MARPTYTSTNYMMFLSYWEAIVRTARWATVSMIPVVLCACATTVYASGSGPGFRLLGQLQEAEYAVVGGAHLAHLIPADKALVAAYPTRGLNSADARHNPAEDISNSYPGPHQDGVYGHIW